MRNDRSFLLTSWNFNSYFSLSLSLLHLLLYKEQNFILFPLVHYLWLVEPGCSSCWRFHEFYFRGLAEDDEEEEVTTHNQSSNISRKFQIFTSKQQNVSKIQKS